MPNEARDDAQGRDFVMPSTPAPTTSTVDALAAIRAADDPRAQDYPEDTYRWRILLKYAEVQDNHECTGLLRGIRACGAALAAGPKGLRIDPRYSPRNEDGGDGDTCWRNERDWQATRALLLKHTATIRLLLERTAAYLAKYPS